jgi:hypothetical protein
MLEKVARILLAYKRQLVKKLKKRTPADRLKARLYYRKNKTKIRLKRRRYLKRTNLFNKTKKLFKRTKPVWYAHKKVRAPKTKAPSIHRPKKTQLTPRIRKPINSLGSKGVKPPKTVTPKKFKFYAPKRK